MGKGKKTFIDRKKAVTFHLVHRSQHDPLVTDETAPQRVLVEATPTKQDTDPTKRREEQKKYGIQFDDDYDYLQHLKKPGHEVVWEYVENPNQAKKNKDGEPKLQLPSSVFASEFEEAEGMLNKAAPRPGPRPDLDPDVIAALDDDFDFDKEENQMEDDFVVQAMGAEDDDEDDDDDDYLPEDDEEDFDSDGLMCSGDEEEEMRDRLGPLMRDHRFDDEETKSRFTEYSMSSSVIRRNEQLSLLDDRFDKFYASYDDPEMGPLDMEEIEGTWGQKHPYVLGCYQLYKKSKKVEDYNKEWDKDRLDKYRTVVDDNEDDDMVELDVEDPKEKKWDCESILSTYSNIYNHPKLIDEPRKAKKIEIDPKTGLPVNVLRGSDNDKLTAKALAKLDSDSVPCGGPKSLCAKSVMSTLSVLSIRPKDESAEEKKERKKLLKEYRTERRIERKANTEAFREEKKRQTHIKINNQNNIQGNKIL